MEILDIAGASNQYVMRRAALMPPMLRQRKQYHVDVLTVLPLYECVCARVSE